METLPTASNGSAPAANDWNEKRIDVLKNTIAKDATKAEFAVFLEYVKSTGLDPFKKEIWFIKAKGQVQMMTGINGFYAVANQDPNYDGIETEIVEENGRIIKAVAKVYRKDRRVPMTAEAYFEEYAKPYGNWKTMPRVMISKCAEAMALRKAFPQQLNGLYSTEEMPREYDQKPVVLEIEQDEAPELTLYHYNFEVLADDPERYAKAKEYAVQNDAEWDSDLGCWVSPNELPRLKTYKTN